MSVRVAADKAFLSTDEDTHVSKLERLAMPFSLNVVGSATPITRDEFIADQTVHAKKLRGAILSDSTASSSRGNLAADEGQWVQGWLAALELAGMLRPLDEAPPIRLNPSCDQPERHLGHEHPVQQGGRELPEPGRHPGPVRPGPEMVWRHGKLAARAPIDYVQVRRTDEGEVEIPMPEMADAASYDLNAAQDTHFINFNVFAGGQSEAEYVQRPSEECPLEVHRQ
jgi:hypothetical protein